MGEQGGLFCLSVLLIFALTSEYLTIDDVDDAVGTFTNVKFVGNDDDGHALTVEFVEKVENFDGRLSVRRQE